MPWKQENTSIRADGFLTMFGPCVRITIGKEDYDLPPETAADFAAFIAKTASETLAASVEAGEAYRKNLEGSISLEDYKRVGKPPT